MNSLFRIIISTSIFVLIGCNSTKTIVESEKVDKTTKIEVPLSGNQYRTDKNFFRATQSGSSSSLSTAKKIAFQNARTELATNIQATIKSVTDQYVNQRNFQDKEEFESKFEELSRTVVNQNLQNVKSIGDEVYKNPDGKYMYWIAIECPINTMLENVAESISKDERLKIDFDKFQYQKIFDAEMEKFNETQN